MYRLCFTTDAGEELCITIPQFIDPRVFDPNPEPWADVRAAWTTDLSVLATLDTVASQLTDRDVRGRLQGVISEAANSYEIPKGSKLEFGIQTA